jgi:hypothetical protein
MKLRTFLLTLLAKGIVITQQDYIDLAEAGYVTFRGNIPTLTAKGVKKAGVQSWDFETLAETLRQMTPAGSSSNGVAWKESLTVTVRRLKKFVELFPEAQRYTEEDVVNAYQAYINYCITKYGSPTSKYRSCLSYFIYKAPERGQRDEITKSKLMTYLEDNTTGQINGEHEEPTNNEAESWIDTLT